MTDCDIDMAVRDDGTILRTIGDGKNWTIQSSGTALNLAGVYFKDINNGWIIAGGDYDSEISSIILHTTNGGKDWTSNALSWGIIRGMRFADDKIGTAVGKCEYCSDNFKLILRTTNVGYSWVRQNTPGTGGFAELFAVCLTDSNGGIALGRSGERYLPLKQLMLVQRGQDN